MEAKLTLHLQYCPPIDEASLLAYLERRAIPGVEEVVNRCYRRTVLLPNSKGIIELEPMEQTNAIRLRLQLNDLSDLNMLVQGCRHLFDLDAVPEVIANVLTTDPLLAPLIKARPGLRVPGTINGFELTVRAILGQQVSVAGARTLAARLVVALGEPLELPQGTLTHFFPTPHAIAQTDLHGLGLTRSRVTALRALAHAVVEEGLTLDRAADREQTITQLLHIPGIGPWTTSYVAMRALGDPDAFPATDLGLRRAFEQLGLAADSSSIERQAETWRPWRAYGAHHLWASLATPIVLDHPLGRSNISWPTVPT
jgi:AraC family transcriptional regulator, regulatory protein of adaptative response / DNA-3-methyladenine glycosylase II